jgi:DNA topoisomerase-6 subunit B
MVIFVHIASVWVPFTSESKEAIAEYDEIDKEITLALRECGRRLGLFLRRRERAASEYRRRNIFELYIEEVVGACNRLKGGKLPTEKLKAQLQKIASSRTGGIKTDETLGKTGAGPEGLPHSIIVTAEGIEGEAPPMLDGSHTVAPETDTSNGIRIKEKRPSTKLGRSQTTKTKSTQKGPSKAATIPSFVKKGASAERHSRAIRTIGKTHLTRKKR